MNFDDDDDWRKLSKKKPFHHNKNTQNNRMNNKRYYNQPINHNSQNQYLNNSNSEKHKERKKEETNLINEITSFFDKQKKEELNSFLSEIFCSFFLHNEKSPNLVSLDTFIDFFCLILNQIPQQFQILKEKKIYEKFNLLKKSKSIPSQILLAKLKELDSIYIFDKINQDISKPIIYEIGTNSQNQDFINIFNFYSYDKNHPFTYKTIERENVLERNKKKKIIIKKKIIPILHIQESKENLLKEECLRILEIAETQQNFERSDFYNTFLFRNKSHSIQKMFDSNKMMNVAKSEKSLIWKTLLSIFRNIFNSKIIYQEFKEFIYFLIFSSILNFIQKEEKKTISFKFYQILESSLQKYSNYICKIFQKQSTNIGSRWELIKNLKNEMKKIQFFKPIPINIEEFKQEYNVYFKNWKENINNQIQTIQKFNYILQNQNSNLSLSKQEENKTKYIIDTFKFQKNNFTLKELLNELNQFKSFLDNLNSNQNQNKISNYFIANLLMIIPTPKIEKPYSFYQIQNSIKNEETRNELFSLINHFQNFLKNLIEIEIGSPSFGLAVFNNLAILIRIIQIYDEIFETHIDQRIDKFKIHSEPFYQFYYQGNLFLNILEANKISELKQFYDKFGTKQNGFGFRVTNNLSSSDIQEEIQFLTSFVENEFSNDELISKFQIIVSPEIKKDDFIQKEKFYEKHFKKGIYSFLKTQIEEIEQKWEKEEKYLNLGLFYETQIYEGEQGGNTLKTCEYYLKYFEQNNQSISDQSIFEKAKNNLKKKGNFDENKKLYTIQESLKNFQQILPKNEIEKSKMN
ncbi:hypothetical protein M0811_12832 [Anaeramoeba ignava]|uniref:Uncharacterized protein n=1 Tax=Anaeramoeba ignava TaxID=1746090 RepID=A0A9Q0R5E5_ANAIG|nr:hypothetical protein M0811_12832 [Anaeramoeba ignava]